MDQVNRANRPDKIWYKIGEVARRLGIAVETIRMYEREGILLIEKTPTGQRLFSNEDVQWIACIRRLIKEKGLNIEGIRRLLALLPCWSMRGCSEHEKLDCTAYRGAVRPCWAMESGIPETCSVGNCRNCPVYQNAIHCGNLKNLLYQSSEMNTLTT